MNLKLLPLRLLAVLLAAYRKGPARPEIDRARLPQARIALMKLDGIGDFILATSFFQTLRRELPGAEVTVFCRKPVGELVRQQFPGWSVVEISWPPREVKAVLLNGANRRRIKSLPPFDLALDLCAYRDFIKTTVASWIPARQKIALKNAHRSAGRGLCLPMEHRVYDRLLPLPDYTQKTILPDLQNHDLLAKHLFPGLPDGLINLPRLTGSDEAKRAVARRFAPGLDAPFLLVCPGARAPIREYPPEKLARAVADAVAGSPLAVVVAGSSQDAVITGAFADTLSNLGVKVLNLTGALNLAEHVVLMSLARAVVCMETSHAHIAGALGRPTIVIIGGGHYGMFAPWGESKTFRWLTNPLPCFNCNWNCIHDRPLCIQDIPVEVISKNLIEVLAASDKAAS